MGTTELESTESSYQSADSVNEAESPEKSEEIDRSPDPTVGQVTMRDEQRRSSQIRQQSGNLAASPRQQSLAESRRSSEATGGFAEGQEQGDVHVTAQRSREPSFGTREPSYGTGEALSLKTCNAEVAQTEMNLKAAAEVLTDDLRLGEDQTNLMVYPAGKDDKKS